MPKPGIGVELFLDEAKSMLEIGEYHDNIVNLQGICYGMDEEKRSLSKVCIVELFQRFRVTLLKFVSKHKSMAKIMIPFFRYCYY